MALSLIHFQDDATNSSPATFTSSFGGVDVPAGSLLVAVISESTNSAGGGTLTDNAGNTYTALITKNPNNATANGFVRVWYCNNCLHLTTAANNFIYTPVGGAGVKVAARWYAFSGAATGNPFDAAVTASAVGSTGIPQVTSGTSAQFNEFSIGVVCVDNTPGTIGLLLSPYSSDQGAIGSTGMLDLGDFTNTSLSTALVKTGGTNTKPWVAIALAVMPLESTTPLFASSATATSITTAVGQAVPAGSLMFVSTFDTTTSAILSSQLTDTQSNTWILITSDAPAGNGANGHIAMWVSSITHALSAADTIRHASSTGASGALEICALYIAGQASATFDFAVGNSANGTSATATIPGAGSTTVANEIVIGCARMSAGGTVANTAWTPTGTTLVANSRLVLQTEIKPTTGAVSYVINGTSGTWVGIIHGYKPLVRQALALGCAAGSYSITGKSAALYTTRARVIPVASGETGFNGTFALTCGVAIPAGSLILVARRDDSSATGARTITDSKSQTWTKISQTPLNNNTGLGPITLWYAWNAKAMTTSDTITTASNSAEICQMSICYVTGILNTSDPLDSAVTATSFGAPANAPTVTSGTPSLANEFIVGVYGTGISIVTDEGFNEDATHGFASSPPRLWNGDGTRGGAIDWGSLTNSGTGTKVFAPSFNTSTNVNWGVIIAGFKPTVAQTLTLLAAPGAYTISGAAAKLETDRLFTLAAGSYAITGAAAKFVEGRVILAAAGSYAISGAAAKLETDRSQQLPAGSYALTGFDATLATARPFKLAAGSYAITGDAASFAIARVVLAEAGVYTITGFPDSNVSAFHLLASAGVYSLGGADAALIIVPAGPSGGGDDDHDRDHGGERGQGHGRMPPPERRHHAELEFFRNREYAKAVAAAVPPPIIAYRNLTTTQHPTSRPSVVPIPPGRHK